MLYVGVAQPLEVHPGRSRVPGSQGGMPYSQGRVPDAGRGQRARRQHKPGREHDESAYRKTSHGPSPAYKSGTPTLAPARPLWTNSSLIARPRNRDAEKPLPGQLARRRAAPPEFGYAPSVTRT